LAWNALAGLSLLALVMTPQAGLSPLLVIQGRCLFWVGVSKQRGHDKRGEGGDDPLIVDGPVDRLGDPGDCNEFATDVLLGLKVS
jgi:hypothetical protein